MIAVPCSLDCIYTDWYIAQISVSEIVGYLKEKSSLIIFDRHLNWKYKYGSKTFCCRGYQVDTVGKNIKKIRECINNPLKED